MPGSDEVPGDHDDDDDDDVDIDMSVIPSYHVFFIIRTVETLKTRAIQREGGYAN